MPRIGASPEPHIAAIIALLREQRRIEGFEPYLSGCETLEEWVFLP